ncbi:MAG: hypothetical protein MZV49_00080 [Rhodopseudomonas palustris]|nr:hypothetical protein [Rhodopseudomonas palustris]
MPARRRILAAVVGAFLAGLAAVAAAQAPQVTASPAPPAPRRVEVRVHVTAHGAFQDDLKLEDFSLAEAGRTQAIGSLALVQGGALTRFQGDKAAIPRLERSYTLLFQAVDWDPKLVQVIEYLFDSVLQPGDTMTLVTPFKPYQLQKDALAHKSRRELSDGMEEVLRKDITRGGGEYRDLINDLRRLTRAISGTSNTFDEDIGHGRDDGTQWRHGPGDADRALPDDADEARRDPPGRREQARGLRRGPPGGAGPEDGRVLLPERVPAGDQAGTMNRLMALYQENFDILAEPDGAVPVLQAGEDVRRRAGQEGFCRRRHRLPFHLHGEEIAAGLRGDHAGAVRGHLPRFRRGLPGHRRPGRELPEPRDLVQARRGFLEQLLHP